MNLFLKSFLATAAIVLLVAAGIISLALLIKYGLWWVICIAVFGFVWADLYVDMYTSKMKLKKKVEGGESERD